MKNSKISHWKTPPKDIVTVWNVYSDSTVTDWKENSDLNYTKIFKLKRYEITKLVSSYHRSIPYFDIKLCFSPISGQLYGLEKFWAFMKYYKHAEKLQIDTTLQDYLSKFKSIEDFRVVEVSYDEINST